MTALHPLPAVLTPADVDTKPNPLHSRLGDFALLLSLDPRLHQLASAVRMGLRFLA